MPGVVTGAQGIGADRHPEAVPERPELARPADAAVFDAELAPGPSGALRPAKQEDTP
jgi:hypothetical protein